MENQLDSVTEKPTCFLRLQGLTCDWSKHNKHSRNIFSVHGFLRLSVTPLKLVLFFTDVPYNS